MSNRMRRLSFSLALLALAAAGQVRAHNFTITDALVVLKTDGTYVVDLTVDVDALALGVSPSTPSDEVVAELESMTAGEFESSIERAKDTLRRRIRIRFDGTKQRPEVSFPEMGTNLIARYEVPTLLGATARLTGTIPEEAVELTFGASRSFMAVHLTILEQSTASGVRRILEAGADSEPYLLGQPAQPPDRARVIADYVVLGFTHILPKGLDHILFVLGLFLLSTRAKPLLWQISAFTVAHTITLGLSMMGYFSLAPRLVETLIALSIAYVAIENLFTTKLTIWRPALVFVFGLLHGLGFASVLRGLGLPEGEFAAALISFNVGVELGQLSVVALAFLAVGWLRDKPWYRRRVVWPASAAIALVGLYWAVTRAWFGV